MPNNKKENFAQPFGNITTRKVNEEVETVEYLPGYRYRIWHNDTTEEFSIHHHDALEIIVCTSKNYTVTIGDELFKLHEGDILFIPPNAEHKIAPPEDGERFIMLFDTAFFDYFKLKSDILNYFSTPRQSTIGNGSHLYPIIYDSLRKIINLYFSGEEKNEIEIYSEFLKITSLMYRNSETDSKNNVSHSDTYDKFVRVLSYIEANYSEDLNLETVADTAGFSKYHFARLFKQYTDTTFYDYLCTKRVLVAKKLLITNMPVTDVAFQTGFNNLTTFCRCFKKYAGCSPSQYKKRFSQDENLLKQNNNEEDDTE